MAALSEHLERLRAKPHHVRRQIAFGSSLAITALVAVGWMGALVSSPRLALDTSGTADTDEGFNAALADTRTNFSSLMGAANEAFATGTTAPAQVIVVDTKTTSTLEAPRSNYNDTKETVIPF